jgi:cytidylate kinase
MKKREASEKKRYKEYYSLDYTDKKIYDLVIDTTKKTPEQVIEEIIKFVKKRSII